MRTPLNVAAFALFLLVSSVAVWIRFVPDPVSRAAFVWTIAIMLFLAAFAIALIGRARPATSIAQVLHDVEHPQDRR